MSNIRLKWRRIIPSRPVFAVTLPALVVWCIWYTYTQPFSLQFVLQHWQISLSVVFGSIIAGATSVGGGAIAFPVLTKVLHIAPLDTKIFSLAIQSIGMTTASLTIILMRVPVEWRVIIWASIGGCFGVCYSAIYLAPLLNAALLKMLFSSMVFSFALTLILILLNSKQRVYNRYLPSCGVSEISILLLMGFIGGVMTGLLGNGIDIVCFSIMVLLFRLSEKVSTPTSVILMAINALVGFALHSCYIGSFSDKIEAYWLAAIPIVVLGAPLGAFFCTLLNNKTISIILIVLISIESISSLILIPLTTEIIVLSSTVFIGFSFIYFRISRLVGYSSVEGKLL